MGINLRELFVNRRSRKKKNIIYRCVTFIIDYHHFPKVVCKLCARSFSVQEKSRYKVACNGLIFFALCLVDQPGLCLLYTSDAADD